MLSLMWLSAAVLTGCGGGTAEPQAGTQIMSPTLPYHEFAGSSAEAGQPDAHTHPFPPASSRAAGDAFVHYLEHPATRQDVVRFWFPDNPEGEVMPVDFEVLQPTLPRPNGDALLLDDRTVAAIIVRSFFRDHTGDFYAGRIAEFSLRRIDGATTHRVPYPGAR